jgi:hypothetical protein
MSEYFLLGNKKFILESPDVINLPPLYMQKEDKESGIWGGGLRSCAVGGCPAVFNLYKDPPLKVVLTKQWQYYLIAINYNMTLENISLILDYRLAFANGTGFRKPDTPRRNFILEQDLDAVDENGKPAYPKFDKDRTCSRSVMTGTEMGSVLRVAIHDGNGLPPLKSGRAYPQKISDIRLEDYLYNPKDHRWMFFAANTVTATRGDTSSVAPFPRGARYEWTGDNELYTWLPHVSRHDIYYPLEYLEKTNRIPSPYRIVRL